MGFDSFGEYKGNMEHGDVGRNLHCFWTYARRSLTAERKGPFSDKRFDRAQRRYIGTLGCDGRERWDGKISFIYQRYWGLLVSFVLKHQFEFP